LLRGKRQLRARQIVLQLRQRSRANHRNHRHGAIAKPRQHHLRPNWSDSVLSADASRYLDGLAVAAHREGVFEKAGRFYRRYRFFILLIAAYLLTGLILLLALQR
jgi:hypothetical protein